MAKVMNLGVHCSEVHTLSRYSSVYVLHGFTEKNNS
jgi:hypothetical protein